MLSDTLLSVFGSTNWYVIFVVMVYDLGTVLTCWINQLFLTFCLSDPYAAFLIPKKWSVARQYLPPFFKFYLSLSTTIKEAAIFYSSATIFAASSVAPGLIPADFHTSTRDLNSLV